MEKENLIQIKNLAFIDGQNLYMNTAKNYQIIILLT